MIEDLKTAAPKPLALAAVARSDGVTTAMTQEVRDIPYVLAGGSTPQCLGSSLLRP